LLIEDDEDDAVLIREYLEEIENINFEVTWESEISKAYPRLLKGNYDVFLVDYRLGSESGIDILKDLSHKSVLTPTIILTGKGDPAVDRNASKYGASDYLVKAELSSSVLERSIRYSLSKGEIIKVLDEKEKKYSSLFERSIDPIILATSNYRNVEKNHSFLQFFSYTTEDDLFV
jgi:DNA-binding response OmpR family regulator